MYSQTVALIIVSTVLPVVATVAVLLRVRARTLKRSGVSFLNASDYLIFASLVRSVIQEPFLDTNGFRS